MSKKPNVQPTPPTVTDAARMKSSFARKNGGATPPPNHVRRIESAAAKAAVKEEK